MNIKHVAIFIYLIFQSTNCNAAKILGVFPFPSRSHSILLEVIMIELSKLGHEITVITNFRAKEKLNNYTEIIIEPKLDHWKTVDTKNLFDLEKINVNKMIDIFYTFGLTTTEYALNNTKVQEFIANDTTNFDLIIAEQFHQEAFLLLAHKYKSPVVTIDVFGFKNYMNDIMGGITPWSHVPHEYFSVGSDTMNIYERFENVFLSLYDNYLRYYYYLPKMNELGKKYFRNVQEPIPSIADLEKNISLILVNSHTALSTPRPSLPNIIPIGGCHIKNPKILPRDIRDFVDKATYGAIYFSLGTNLKSADLPPEKLEIFLKTFSKMKQHIVWKFENNKIPNLPPNVMIKKWMPQNDVLAHPHVRLFITHGGLLSTQEAIFRNVPMLGFPVYVDQILNMKRAQNAGYAISLSLSNLTEILLHDSLLELLNNPTYYNNISSVSKMFRDRPVRALDDAVYWIQYAIRYKGAKQLRSSGLNLSWFSYFLLDIIFIISFVIISIILLIYMIIKIIIKNRRAKIVHRKKL